MMKINYSLYARLLALLVLPIVGLFAGCSEKSKCEDLIAVVSSREGRSFIENWIQNEFSSDLEGSGLAEMDSTVGLGFYRVHVSVDWSPLFQGMKVLRVKILGEPSAPKAVVFVFETRCAIIYNLVGGSLVGVNGIVEEELVYIDDRILVFDGGAAR